MPKPSRLSLVKEAIFSHFDDAPGKVYSESMLNGLLEQDRAKWALPASTRVPGFISFLERQGKLKPIELTSEEYSRSIKRYSWGKASPLELALSIKSRAYLCHGTAMTLHGLMKLPLKTIYLNSEQSDKSQDASSLNQRGIDLAFKGRQRQSKLIYRHADISVVMISGKNTGRLGVEEIAVPGAASLQATNLEKDSHRHRRAICLRGEYRMSSRHTVRPRIECRLIASCRHWRRSTTSIPTTKPSAS